jgi:hypothetical protein
MPSHSARSFKKEAKRYPENWGNPRGEDIYERSNASRGRLSENLSASQHYQRHSEKLLLPPGRFIASMSLLIGQLWWAGSDVGKRLV